MNKIKRFKHLSVLAVMLTMALSVLSIPGAAWSGLGDEVREFHLFLRDHPRIASDLRANPNLANSRRYLDNREDLARFLRHRPSLRAEMRSNPGRVMGPYYTYNRSDRFDRFDRYDRFDRFGRWR